MRRAARIAGGVTLSCVLVTGLVPASAAADPAPLPAITAPAASGHGTLVDSSTGRPFVVRGNNYHRLALEYGTTDRWYVSTFDPGRYDADRADAALAYMAGSGYNTVRVFINPGDPTANASGHPIGLGRGDADDSVGYAPYYDNVADFVRRATAHHVYVLPALDYFPFNAYYQGIANGGAQHANIAGWNEFYLQPSWIAAKAAYLRNFVTEMRDRLGPDLMTTFLGLETDNEATFQGDQAPFATTAGTVVGPDGVTYDMSTPADRQQAADAGMVVYADQVTDAVHDVDPGMLVSTGMFTYGAVGKSPNGMPVHCSHAVPEGDPNACKDGVDYRYPSRPASLSRYSRLSFLDLHVYPQPAPWTPSADLSSSEWDLVRGITILGEYGAQKEYYGGDLTTAAYAMRDLQVATCKAGFAGWLFWTWDTDDGNATQEKFFNATQNNGAVNGILAPAARPDPCAA